MDPGVDGRTPDQGRGTDVEPVDLLYPGRSLNRCEAVRRKPAISKEQTEHRLQMIHRPAHDPERYLQTREGQVFASRDTYDMSP